jgi:MraZ protein
MSNTSRFSEEDRETYRSYIGPSQELEIDKAGRILVPQSLRDYAGLTKEVTVLGLVKYIEIWDAEKYALHKKESREKGTYKENQKLKERISF